MWVPGLPSTGDSGDAEADKLSGAWSAGSGTPEASRGRQGCSSSRLYDFGQDALFMVNRSLKTTAPGKTEAPASLFCPLLSKGGSAPRAQQTLEGSGPQRPAGAHRPWPAAARHPEKAPRTSVAPPSKSRKDTINATARSLLSPTPDSSLRRDGRCYSQTLDSSRMARRQENEEKGGSS